MNVPVYPVRARAQQLTADSSVRKCLDFDVEVEEEEWCYRTCYELRTCTDEQERDAHILGHLDT